MIKKQQKWIAWLVVFTFVWLLQISTMPMAAANAPEKISSANSDQGPRYIEEEGRGAGSAAKKSIVPIILIGVGVVAVAAVLILVVFKSDYNIVGEWRYSWKDDGDTTWVESNQPVVFSGDKSSGTLTIWSIPGTYTVNGKNVVFTIDYLDFGPNDYYTHTGTFVSKNKITGTWIYEDGGWTGTFELVRASSAASSGLVQALHADRRRQGKK
ncbi:MAG: hypothetical protein NTW95_07590 [Candidatus Aminicenantes bacterium]|nr:hypothetical protein [Candidatus Aminicenantes bacterium]